MKWIFHTFLQIIFGIFVLLLFCACNIKYPEEQAENEVNEILDVDGNLKSRISIKEGKLNGEVVTYYPGGQISTVSFFIDNKKEGIEKKYYKRGALYRTRFFEGGRLNGVELRYYPTGKIKTRQEFKDNMPGIGLIEYSPTGKVITDYPKIEFKIINERDYKEQKLIILTISDGSENVSYYIGELLEGKYFNTKAEQELSSNGEGEIWISPGYSGNLNIVAKIVRQSRGLFITQAKVEIKNGEIVQLIYE